MASTDQEFPISDEIKQEIGTLGISRVCLKQSGQHIPDGLIIYFTSGDSVECKYYYRHMKQTLYNELKPALIKSGRFNGRTITKIMVVFAKAWRERTEEEKKEDEGHASGEEEDTLDVSPEKDDKNKK